MGGNPDIDLAETLFPDSFLELQKCAGIWIVGVDADAEEVIAIACAAVFPGTGNTNSVLGDTAKAIAQFLGSAIEQRRIDGGAVVIGQR